MLAHAQVGLELARAPRRWLVTGAAGFIGSHLVEELLRLGQDVRGFDNFATGSRANLDEVRGAVGPAAWARFELLEGDLRDPATCVRAASGRELVLHQAALGSVPRSLQDPLTSLAVNVQGFANLLEAARAADVKRCVWASSSSVYGDHPDLPRREDVLGHVLSPYAASKRMGEVLAEAFARSYGLALAGLRYFNVFGPRQDPLGPYAAVIPRWIQALLAGERVEIFGDGLTSRDFCPVANVVEANLCAALVPAGGLFNVALGRSTTLLELLAALQRSLIRRGLQNAVREPLFRAPRAGDVRASQADLSRARAELGYVGRVAFEEGLERTLDWHAARTRQRVH
ncbi:MAG: NAD-dependent epimerase/dehydratase family protein [Planctomycetes bacterium]|nr:NAD-dependent epimerase/dehydratase family protein [Planctomycetota bacterium]